MSSEYEMKRLLQGLEHVGDCGVDSGTIMIVDPCYVLNDKDAHDAPTYEEFLDEADENRDNNRSGSFTSMSFHGGVIVETAHGDGLYPVYVRKDRRGCILQVVIDFDQVLFETVAEDAIDLDLVQKAAHNLRLIAFPTFDQLEDDMERDIPDDLAA